jgi:L-lactate dehydrogenase
MSAVVGRKGIVRAMPIQLDEEEQAQLESCAKGLREVIEGVEVELSADRTLKKALGQDKGS